MILKTLQINNFLSHENTTINFGAEDKTLLDGRSGSGKSSIVDAIIWAFYGKGRTDNRGLVRRGTKSASVSLKLSEGSREVVITRTISSSGKNTLVVTQNTGTNGQFLPIERVGLKDTQDFIEKTLLKASYELFTNSICYLQGSGTDFATATASVRKDLLLEIVGASNFDELYDKTNTAIKTNELDHATSMVKIDTLQTTIKNNQERAAKRKGLEEQLEKITKVLEELRTISSALLDQKNSMAGMSQQLADKMALSTMLFGYIRKTNERLEKNKKEIDENNAIDMTKVLADITEIERLEHELSISKQDTEKAYLAQQRVNAHLANKPEMHNYSDDIETINKRLVPLLESSFSCPSGDDCPFVIPIKGQITFLQEQIKEKKEKTELEKKRMEAWELEYAAITPRKEKFNVFLEQLGLTGKISKLAPSKVLADKYTEFGKTLEARERDTKEQTELKETLEAQLETAEEQIEKLNKSLNNFSFVECDNKLKETNKDIQAMVESSHIMVSEITLAIDAQENIERSTLELVGLQEAVRKTQTEKESLSLLKEALGPKGIKAVVVDYLIPQLEERINALLGQMSDFRIRLDTQKATVDEEGVKEGLFITVLNDLNEELPFASYSGGEKVKITIAISEALASLMNQVGFRIMDENIVSLDSESTHSFLAVLRKLQEKFPQLLVISHLQEVKDLFEKQIVISKVNGISKII